MYLNIGSIIGLSIQNCFVYTEVAISMAALYPVRFFAVLLLPPLLFFDPALGDELFLPFLPS